MSEKFGFSEVKQAAYGRWAYIHHRAGISLKTTNPKKHQSCPGCGGRDRFRVDKDYQDSGQWLCGGGGDLQSGDGFALLGHVLGLSPADQLKAVKEALGLSNSLPDADAKRIREQAAKHRAATAAAAAAKDERHRMDFNVDAAMLQLDHYMKFRHYCQRVTRKALKPLPEELAAASELISCLGECYGEVMQ